MEHSHSQRQRHSTDKQARRGSARFGSAWLGSARLGPVRSGPVRSGVDLHRISPAGLGVEPF